MNTAGALICMHCGRPMLTSIAIGGLLYHPECAQPPALNPRRPLDAFDEAAIRRIVREEMGRSDAQSKVDDQEPTAGSSHG